MRTRESAELKAKRKQYDDLRKEINELELCEREALIPEMKKRLEGTYWKYNNTYGSGDRWWLYAKVLSIGNGKVILAEAQITSLGYIEVKQNEHGWDYFPRAEWLPAKKEEWETIVREIRDRMAGIA